jgi:hypothetical protein
MTALSGNSYSRQFKAAGSGGGDRGEVTPSDHLVGRRGRTPAIHNQLNRVFCASAGTVGGRPLETQMAVQTEFSPPFSAPSSPQCGMQMLIVRISRDWPT